MIRLFFLFLIGCTALEINAQTAIRYALDLSGIAQHELHISIHFQGLGTGPLHLRMPDASPGRYATHNFAKNVYGITAERPDGSPLSVYRTSPFEWSVSGHDGEALVQYTLFGDRADGTYSGIDSRKVHLNMPASFLYGVDMGHRPIEMAVDLNAHPDWKVATQLEVINDTLFRAPDYYYFFDSPTIIGPLESRAWTSESNGTDYRIEMALLHEGTDEEFDQFAEWTQRVVETQKAIFGELPDFDFGRYTFLCSYNPYVYGDGMEHRNSTICSSASSLERNARGLIGTISHEFFHAWNVERIRPNSLEPFDFDAANMSDALWFAEGFTSYYDGLTLARAGILQPADLARELTGLFNRVYNAPGRQLFGPIGMSQQAPFVDAATANDANNFANIFISYYSYGAVLGYLLDLELRKRFEEITLDNFMREVWQRYGRTEIPYEIADLERVLADVCGDELFARSFFRQSIYGSDLPAPGPLLAPFGFVARQPHLDKVGFWRLNLSYTSEGARVVDKIRKNNPLYPAGVSQGAVIVEMAGQPLTSEEAFEAITDSLEIGQSYTVRYLEDGIEEAGMFTAGPDITWEVVLKESEAGATLTTQEQANRQAWLGASHDD